MNLENYQKNKIGKNEIANSNFMMCIRSSMKQYLENRSKEFSFKDCVLFYSMWEGYKKQENMKEFLKFMEEKGIEIISLHTSGHADEKDFDKYKKFLNTDNTDNCIIFRHKNRTKIFDNPEEKEEYIEQFKKIKDHKDIEIEGITSKELKIEEVILFDQYSCLIIR